MKSEFPAGRLLSLDAYRGITMFLLLAEAAFLYGALTDYFSEGSVGAAVMSQFHHHPWHGLRFWDLIQPFFMFIVGVVVKRIATSSFVLASGGWAILALACFYWLVDVKGYKRWTTFFAIVGANSIFIYLFAETIGHQWLVGFGRIFGNGLLEPLGVSSALAFIASALVTLGLMWYLCYFLYRKKLFFKV